MYFYIIALVHAQHSGHIVTQTRLTLHAGLVWCMCICGVGKAHILESSALLKMKYSTAANKRDNSSGINVSARAKVTEVPEITVNDLISAPLNQGGGTLASSYCSELMKFKVDTGSEHWYTSCSWLHNNNLSLTAL